MSISLPVRKRNSKKLTKLIKFSPIHKRNQPMISSVTAPLNQAGDSAAPAQGREDFARTPGVLKEVPRISISISADFPTLSIFLKWFLAKDPLSAVKPDFPA